MSELIKSLNNDPQYKIPECKVCGGENACLDKYEILDTDCEVYIYCPDCKVETTGTRTDLTDQKNSWGLPGLKKYIDAYNNLPEGGYEKFELDRFLINPKKFGVNHIVRDVSYKEKSKKWEVFLKGPEVAIYINDFDELFIFLDWLKKVKDENGEEEGI